MTKQRVVYKASDILGGIPVFVGTRVPARTLLDYLEADRDLSEFLEDLPTVTREQAVTVLEAERMLAERTA